MAAEARPGSSSEYALVVLQQGKPQQILLRYVSLLVRYRYGLEMVTVTKFVEAFSAIQRLGRRVRCAFVVQGTRLGSRSSILPLSDEGAIPLFLLLPRHLVEEHRTLCHRMQNVHFCAWENAFSHTGSSLHKVVAAAFAELDIGDLFRSVASMSPEEAEERLTQRLDKLGTLPTVPKMALRIMRLVEDPKTTMEQLVETMTRDPAVVHRLIQVVNATAFAGAANREPWSLEDAIVRLGRKQVGAIALQIQLMNSLVRPEDSGFDLERFWRHSVACALVADRLAKDERLSMPEELQFSSCWIAALLHDIGKLVLGFFFWAHFEEVAAKMTEESLTFREAEKALGDFANHEFLGKLLVQRSRINGDISEAVGCHNSPAGATRPLVWLVHVADGICRELGLGSLPDEKHEYDASVLHSLRLERSALAEIVEALRPELATQVDDVVERCLRG